jgi:hypothetical protein
MTTGWVIKIAFKPLKIYQINIYTLSGRRDKKIKHKRATTATFRTITNASSRPNNTQTIHKIIKYF